MKTAINLSLLIACVALCGCTEKPKPAPQSASSPTPAPGPPSTSKAVPFRVPSESEITDTIALASIRRGRALIHNTKDSLPHNVGARLNCASCHQLDGTVPDAMPLVGVYSRFPQYRARSGRIDLLEDRINDCFERSLNGKAIPVNSSAMRDMVTYMAFLSRGIPAGSETKGQGVPKLDPLPGDTVRGHEIFLSTCAKCHNVDGGGNIAIPPLWGKESFNIGAGMARLRTAAAFIHQVMPLDNPGSLTPQQAYDVATYVTTRPRPDFKGKENDWPRGGAPPDVAYPTLSTKKNAGTPAPRQPR